MRVLEMRAGWGPRNSTQNYTGFEGKEFQNSVFRFRIWEASRRIAKQVRDVFQFPRVCKGHWALGASDLL